MSDVITTLTAALAGTGAIVRAVPPDSWQRSSPCADWTVREVTNHLVGGLRIFTGQLTGDPPGAATTSTGWGGVDAYRVPEVFGPAVPAAGHDPAHRRLLAFLGRDLATAAHRVS